MKLDISSKNRKTAYFDARQHKIKILHALSANQVNLFSDINKILRNDEIIFGSTPELHMKLDISEQK